jgi:hypothetical protein
LKDIELCEQLIYYCAKTFRASQKTDVAEEQKPESTEDAQKKIQDFLAKGKM